MSITTGRERMSSNQSCRSSVVPLSVPHIAGNEWTYVKECLDTGWVSSVGAFVERFERHVASYVGAKYGVATASGTAALHLALQVAGVRPNDEVLVSTLTFIAPANAIRYLGAWPVFIDAEADYWQIDPNRVQKFLVKECVARQGGLYNRTSGRRLAAILPVDILGHPCAMRPIHDIAEKYGLPVIEDATESLGAWYDGQKVGTLSGMACFSFNGNKLVTTGGGGMVVTDDERFAQKVRYLSTQAKDDPIEYVHHEVGYNYRLTNIQAAVGCAQMEHIDEFVAAKRKTAERYTMRLREIAGITPMREATWAKSSFWMYTVLLNSEVLPIDRHDILKRLKEGGIESRPLWQPLHRSPAHAASQAYGGNVAERIQRQALSLPCSVGLSHVDQDRVTDALIDICQKG